ncbi:MAG: response regulator [Campylobacterota bacterium]|nr:response regulator [Campylobacterota bacterium]
MKTSLKNILKVLKVMYIDEQDDVPKTIQNILKIFFKEVYYINNLQDAMEVYSSKHPDIIISEVGLKGCRSCLQLLKNIRHYNHLIPIIITSANKDEEILLDAIRLQLIDFLVKPLTLDNFIYPLNNAAKHILHHGNVVVSLSNDAKYNYINKNINIQNKIFKLSKNESRLIELLLANEGKVISNSEIEFHIWGEEYVSDSAFKSLFKRLRDKIGNDIIKNSPGHGYYLNSQNY